MDINSLTVGQLKEITQLACGVQKVRKTEKLGWQIVILQRGWVMVGRLTKTGHQCVLENASVIRRWGTTNGLGELADTGPLPETRLEPCKLPVRFHWLTVIATIECGEKWDR